MSKITRNKRPSNHTHKHHTLSQEARIFRNTTPGQRLKFRDGSLYLVMPNGSHRAFPLPVTGKAEVKRMKRARQAARRSAG